jgi:Autophagy protein ATG9
VLLRTRCHHASHSNLQSLTLLQFPLLLVCEARINVLPWPQVRADFQSLFSLRAALILQELASLLLLPWLCAVELPRCADDVAKFLRNVRAPL